MEKEERNELRPNYPPVEHFMRDCGQWLEWNGEDYRAGLQATPHLSAAPGGLRAGIWAALADLVGGAVATRTVRPNWIATSDMSVHLFSPVYEGELHVTTRLLRHGKRTAIIEANFFAGEQKQRASGPGHARFFHPQGTRRNPTDDGGGRRACAPSSAMPKSRFHAGYSRPTGSGNP